jgi:hypothetical protein
MAKERDADRGSSARRAHIRNEAGVRSRLIAKAMLFASTIVQIGPANHGIAASRTRKGASQLSGSVV